MMRRGSILILVLFVLTVLSLIALSLSYRTGVETRDARHEAIRIKLASLSRSAASIAISRIKQNTNDYDHPAEPWCMHASLAEQNLLPEWSQITNEDDEEPEYRTTYSVIDEDGKLNLLYASSEALEKFGLSPSQIDSFFDWIDEDNIARAEGVEDEYYLLRKTPYLTKNKPLDILDELFLIRGMNTQVYWGEDWNHNKTLDTNEDDGIEQWPVDNMDGELQLGLVDVLTVYGDGKVNLNTAPRLVLETLPITEQAVDQIIGYRMFDQSSSGSLDDHAFRSTDDIALLQGLTDADKDVLTQITKFSSHYYRVVIESLHLPTGLKHRLTLVVQHDGNNFGIILWQ